MLTVFKNDRVTLCEIFCENLSISRTVNRYNIQQQQQQALNPESHRGQIDRTQHSTLNRRLLWVTSIEL